MSAQVILIVTKMNKNEYKKKPNLIRNDTCDEYISRFDQHKIRIHMKFPIV